MTTAAATLAALIRTEVKAAGVKARVRVTPGLGSVQVFVPAYGVEFSEDEQRAIRSIGKRLGCTLVRGLPIIVEQMTDPHGMEFYA